MSRPKRPLLMSNSALAMRSRSLKICVLAEAGYAGGRRQPMTQIQRGENGRMWESRTRTAWRNNNVKVSTNCLSQHVMNTKYKIWSGAHVLFRSQWWLFWLPGRWTADQATASRPRRGTSSLKAENVSRLLVHYPTFPWIPALDRQSWAWVSLHKYTK